MIELSNEERDEQQPEIIYIPDDEGNEEEFEVLMKFEVDGSDVTYIMVIPVDSDEDTDEVYAFRYEEDDNGDGLFTSTSEDMYSIEIPVNWVGWKLISVKYSDLLCLVNGAASTPAGNGTHNSDKIQQINMLHLANPSSGFAKAKIDYVIFTENGPLIP